MSGQANAVDARLSGVYTGDADERFTFTPTGDGTIGTTAGLQVQVRDRAGNLVTTLDVGAGYVPGTALEVADGIKVQFGLGELSATQGDRFGFDAVADSDSTDALVALGINGLFTGSDASNLGVRADLRDDPGLLAISLSGDAGDATLLQAMVGLEQAPSHALDGDTLGRYWGELAGDVGFEAAKTDGALSAGESVLQSLEQRQASVSGVNVDEELADLVQYEQSFAAAAQYISVVNSLGDELLHLI